MLSKGLLLSTSNHDFRHLEILSDAVKKMSEGELLQIEKTRRLNLNEEVYFEIIRNKTASLLSSACAVGAYSTSKDENICKQLGLFGENTGIAFQIKDDLFDYGNDDIGKPTGNDIKEKKLTLPLIYTLNKVDRTEKRKIINLLKNRNDERESVQYIINKVIETGGIKYAAEKMNQYRDNALTILNSFPASDARTAMEDLVRYTTDRKY